MNIIENKESIDRCRFCFMCRHVCTLGRCTSDEALTPRSQALGLSMVLRDTIEFSDDLIENIYKCCLCGYCEDWCQGGWDFPSAVISARKDAVESGKAPAKVESLKDETIKNKNLFGKEKVDAKLAERIKNMQQKTKNLIIFGSDNLYADTGAALSFIEITENAEESFMALEEENTIAFELYNLGYYDLAKGYAEKLVEDIKKSGAARIVVLSADVQNFLEDDIKHLGIELNGVEIKGALEYLLDLLNEGKIQIKKKITECATYHDSNAHARKLNVIEQPRAIMDLICGDKFKDMIWNKNESHSAGSQMNSRLYPDVAKKILSKKAEDVLEINPKLLVTASVYDNIALSAELDGKVKVQDLFQLVNSLI